jgi:hypothetical protein
MILVRMQAHVDKPSGFAALARPKVSKIVSCVTWMRSSNFAGLQSAVKAHSPGGQTDAVGAPTWAARDAAMMVAAGKVV